MTIIVASAIVSAVVNIAATTSAAIGLLRFHLCPRACVIATALRNGMPRTGKACNESETQRPNPTRR